MEEKNIFRSAMKERLGRLSENDRRVESQVIVRELQTFIDERAPKEIGVYIPFKDEPNIVPLLEKLLEDGYSLSIPYSEGDEMEFVHIRTLEGLRKNALGLPAPEEGVHPEKVDERSLDIVLIPGRAFSETGDRMGRGNGGFDRWIEKQRIRNPETLLVGVCFDCQLVQEVPTEKHDQPVDAIVTSSKTIESGR